jgi:hypothetical protein
MSTLANSILQGLVAHYQVGWSIAEGRMIHDIKLHNPDIAQLYRFPHEIDAALKELAQEKFIEKHSIFPDWKMLKFPK